LGDREPDEFRREAAIAASPSEHSARTPSCGSIPIPSDVWSADWRPVPEYEWRSCSSSKQRAAIGLEQSVSRLPVRSAQQSEIALAMTAPIAIAPLPLPDLTRNRARLAPFGVRRVMRRYKSHFEPLRPWIWSK
jgi:hypothetical protein